MAWWNIGYEEKKNGLLYRERSNNNGDDDDQNQFLVQFGHGFHNIEERRKLLSGNY